MYVCILAAGQSTRMKSKLSKMLHPVCGRPMIVHVVNTVTELQPKSIHLVVGHQRDQIINALETKQVDFVVQEQQLGTAHAVQEYCKQLPVQEGTLLVMNGDTPLIRAQTLRRIMTQHQEKKASISLVSTEIEDPAGYGRIVRNANGTLARIVEEADADADQKRINEVNSGIYVFDIAKLRELLPKVQSSNKQEEFYLPDVIELAISSGLTVIPISGDSEEMLGINNRAELAVVERLMRKRINNAWMIKGVTMHDPDTTYVDADVRLANDVVLYPNVVLEGETLVAPDVTIYSNCRITNSYIDSECVIYENSSVEQAHLETGVKIGPFARLRPDTHLAKGVRIGNFVEIKKSTLGEGTKANHLAYLGDATIGKGVNVGAGTITCNYDGSKKYPTVIEDEVFIGSDSQLVAPVTIGKGAYVAAGSSIVEDVPPGSLGIARGKQVNKEGWVAKKKKPKSSH